MAQNYDNDILAPQKVPGARLASVTVVGKDPTRLTTYLSAIIARKGGVRVAQIATRAISAVTILFHDCPRSFLEAARRGTPCGTYVVYCIPEECQFGFCQVLSPRREKKPRKVKEPATKRNQNGSHAP